MSRRRERCLRNGASAICPRQVRPVGRFGVRPLALLDEVALGIIGVGPGPIVGHLVARAGDIAGHCAIAVGVIAVVATPGTDELIVGIVAVVGGAVVRLSGTRCARS